MSDTRAEPHFNGAFHTELSELIRWRRDVRNFRTDPVPPELVAECIGLANLAPSVGLSQPWRFVEVQSSPARQEVIASFERCNADALATYDDETKPCYARLKLQGLREAPVQLAVFSDESTLKGRMLGRLTMPETLRYSVVMAIHTFWLAARARGLGTGWVSILDPHDVARACGAPSHWELVAYLCIGWPVKPDRIPELETAGWEKQTLDPEIYRRI